MPTPPDPPLDEDAGALPAWAARLWAGTRLDDKLAPPPRDLRGPFTPRAAPSALPGRPPGWAFAETRPPLPPSARLGEARQRARLLRVFAGHELQAIEIFARALLEVQDATPAWIERVVQTITEEQAHFQMYLDRAAELDPDPGPSAESHFLIDAVGNPKTRLDLDIRMGLLFEQANLDHLLLHAERMQELGDEITARLLRRVLADEIEHVRHAWSELQAALAPGEEPWARFVLLLPPPLGPRRARGERLHLAPRRAAGLHEGFVRRLALTGDQRGRVPDLWVFNPDSEEELARPGQPPSPAARALGEDLAAILWPLALPSDRVLLPRPPRLPWLEHLAQAGFELPDFCTAPGQPPPGRLRSWGPSERLRARFPGLPSAATATAAFRKDLAHAWLAELAPGLAGRACRGVEEAMAAAAELQARGLAPAVKPLLSAAGRGILRRAEPEAIARLLRHQPGVLVVPWFPRHHDLSLHFDLPGPRLRGLTLFQADAGGRWQWSQASDPLRGLPEPAQRLLHGLPGGLPTWLGRHAEALARRLAPLHPEGPVGVDMFIGARPDGGLFLHPLVEINPRFTMGRVALALRPRLAPGVQARLRILPAQGEPGRVETDRHGRLWRGRLYLTDPAGARRMAVLDIEPEPRGGG